jgi:hypothetical protein
LLPSEKASHPAEIARTPRLAGVGTDEYHMAVSGQIVIRDNHVLNPVRVILYQTKR